MQTGITTLTLPPRATEHVLEVRALRHLRLPAALKPHVSSPVMYSQRYERIVGTFAIQWHSLNSRL